MNGYLTLDHYFERAGKSVPKSPVSPPKETQKAPSKNDFTHLFKGLCTESKPAEPASKGLALADYRSSPIRVKATSANVEIKDTEPAKVSLSSYRTGKHVQEAGRNLEKFQNSRINRRQSPDPDVLNIGDSYDDRQKIDAVIQKAAEQYDLQPGLIRGVIKAESDFNTDVVSRAGAQGLMQLMPGTARDLGVSDPFDIEQNIDGGVRYLKNMMDRFEGDVKLALAAYNAGPGAVEKHGGVPPYQETLQYIKRVLKYSR